VAPDLLEGSAVSDPQTLRGGRYLLVERLGEGGMATVWRAFDQRLQVWRAIKILAQQFTQKKKIMSRFESEAQMMALLEHPHIVRVYDVDNDGEHAFIVMELVEGGSLVDWLDRHGKMPPRLTIDVMVDVCQALAYAHQREVVHRDIKPHNIMIDRKGVCKLTDFGIARAGEDDQGLTRTGAVMGTWGFMAPEQRSDSKHIDHRADVYAMGATLYALVCNRTPLDLFAADRDPEMLDGVPEALIPVLLKACAYRPQERHSTVEELAAALLAVREQLPEDPPDRPALARDLPPPRMPPQQITPGETIIAPDDDDLVPPPALPPPLPPEPTIIEIDEPRPPPVVRPPQQTAARWMVPLTLAACVMALGLWWGGRPTPVAEPVIIPLNPPAIGVAAGTEVAPATPPIAPPVVPPGPEVVKPVAPEVVKPVVPEVVKPPEPGPEKPPEVVKPPVVDPPPPPEEPKSTQCFKDVEGPLTLKVGVAASFHVKTCRQGSVTLHYRPVGESSWFKKSMALRFGDYYALVNVDETSAAGLEWYVSGEGVTDGSASRPHRVGP
jgi:serine/threonine protein kinase